MVQGPARVTRHTTEGHYQNTGVHQNEENSGVHQNSGVRENAGVHQNKHNAGVQENTNSPQNDHNDPQNYPTIKTENTIDATGEEDENEELEEAPMGKNEHQESESKENETEDAKRDDNTREPHTYYEADNYDISSAMVDLRGYACLHATLYCEPNQQDNVMRNPLVTTIITQYHVFKVLKLFGEPGVAAILKELKQLHGRMFVDLKNADEMTTCQKKVALQYIMFLNQKRLGKINGRGCADGRKPHKYLIKDYTRAPTVAMEALFLTCLIDAMDHHEVVTLDIHGAFMQADTEGETVHMKLEVKMADLLTKLDPKLYQKYVTN